MCSSRFRVGTVLMVLLAVGGMPSAAEHETGTEVAPMSAGPNPGMLRQCQQACKQGSAAVLDFCRSIPDTRIRGACWAYEFAVLPACLGFCFVNWGA